MTAKTLKNESEICQQNNINDYISKPFKPYLLYEKIYSALNKISEVKNGHPDTLVNLEYLYELSEGDSSFAAEMLKTFLDRTPYAIDEIRLALSINNYTKLKSEVHKHKNSLLFVSSGEVIGIAETIESMGASADKNILDRQVETL